MTPAAPFVLLEDRIGSDPGGRLYTGAHAILTCDGPDGADAVLAEAELAALAGHHVAGWLSYECGSAFEPRLSPGTRPAGDQPLLWLGVFESCERLSAAALDRCFAARPPQAPLTGLRPGASREAHKARVRRALELIAAGDLYQVNLTFPLRFTYEGCPVALYAALRTRQPAAYGALVSTGDSWILSVSPELFVDVAQGMATTRPMKGTTPRGDTPAEDAARLAALLSCPKQRAENLMIVDLLRNDLSRVCRAGTVRTPHLFTPETYPTLHTLTSTVTGALQDCATPRQVLGALFPCGSVVGAPKIRASEVIAELEPEPRGVYTGAIGAMSPDGGFRFNVAIRTATLRNGQGVYGVGGGIVAESDPDGEYDEALLKGRVIADLAGDFQLIETFRWEADRFVRLEQHLARLMGSAEALGFAGDAGELSQALSTQARGWAGSRPRRVRLLLHRNGRFEITSSVLDTTGAETRRLVLVPDRLDPADPFLRHKTTLRTRYEQALAHAVAAGGDEGLLLNRAGHVADASRATLFVRRGGRLLTPPVEDGALPGVLRQSLLESGEAVVQQLGPQDLEGAELYVGSSLRGLSPAALI